MKAEQYTLTIRPTGKHVATSLQRLRRFIKALGRGYGYRVTSIREDKTMTRSEQMESDLKVMNQRIVDLRARRESTPEGPARNRIRDEMSRLIDRRDSFSDRLNALHRKEFYESL